jgi:hypothetical protein
MNITQEDEKRMDIIGQNGNDGLHYDTGSNENIEKDIYQEKQKEKPPTPSRGSGYWF